MGEQILEYRGVEGLVAAEIIQDDSNAFIAGVPFAIAGVAEISRTTEASNEAHYYDNMPAIIVSNTAADEVTISTSAIPLDVFAKITGQQYDDELGVLIEGSRDFKYFALGYKTKKTNGDEVYVWRFKGTFNIPDQTNSTENDGTDANGQELVFTGIQTTYKFNKTGKGAKAMNVDVAKGLANVTNFFETVTTPDTLSATTPQIGTLGLLLKAGTSGKTTVDFITPGQMNNTKFMYKIGSERETVAYDDTISTGWNALALDTDISANENQIITVVECTTTSPSKARKVGFATVTSDLIG